MDQNTWTTIVAIFASVMASTGFWAIVQRWVNNRSAQTRLLLGLAHDRIIHTGMQYIERGWISKYEYDDFMIYLVNPYSEFGGNGLADRVIEGVKRIPIKRIRTTDTLNIVDPEGVRKNNEQAH